MDLDADPSDGPTVVVEGHQARPLNGASHSGRSLVCCSNHVPRPAMSESTRSVVRKIPAPNADGPTALTQLVAEPSPGEVVADCCSDCVGRSRRHGDHGAGHSPTHERRCRARRSVIEWAMLGNHCRDASRSP